MSDLVENAIEYVQEKTAEYRKKPLQYYFDKEEEPVTFNKYTIDTVGIIEHKESGETPSYNNGEYNIVKVYDDAGKSRMIRVARAVASTFLGKPPTLEHTADHIISEQKKNDSLDNIRWLDQPGQKNNRDMPETLKTAFFVVKDGVEKTAKEWVAHMNATKAPEQREYTTGMIMYYARTKNHGFTFKEYPDLPGEVWKPVKVSGDENEDPEKGTANGRGGYWKMSNKNRVKYVSKHAENVLSGDRLGLWNGYPTIKIDKKRYYCHVLSFMMFHPKEWKLKKDDEIVLHEKDDRMDFRPDKLLLGTQSDNMKDAHDNGKHDGTKCARMKCASYINGAFEKNHDSQTAAAEYIKSKGLSKASVKNVASAISMALSDKCDTAYGRTWVKL